VGAGTVLYFLISNAREEHVGYTKQPILIHDNFPVNIVCVVGDRPSVSPLAPDKLKKDLEETIIVLTPFFQ
jgi:hypothetical protein